MKKTNPQNPETQINALRAAIIANRQNRAELAATPLTVDLAKAQLRHCLDAMAQAGKAELAARAQSFQHPHAAHYLQLIDPACSLNPTMLSNTLEKLWVWCHREALERILSEELEQLIPADRPTPEQVKAMIDQLDAEWLTLEKAEERLIREMEATGYTIDRRGDAHPPVVLAEDAELS